MASERNSSTANYRSDQKPGKDARPEARGAAHDDRADSGRATERRTPEGRAQETRETRPQERETRPQERAPGSRADEPPRPAQPPASNTGMESAAGPDNLFFTAPRPPVGNDPTSRVASPATESRTHLTSHVNDPAMRRDPADAAGRGAHSAISPLARDGATPLDEDARLRQEAADADERARLKGINPRADVTAWHQAEENRQGDLPGRPRADLPEPE
jgi:hypothetical protein